MTALDDKPVTATPGRRARHRRGPHGRASTALVAVLALFLAAVAAAVLSGNYQIRPVLSGSMRPGFSVGGVVITKRVPLSEIKVRDVIVFTRPNQPSELVVHRVTSLTRAGSSLTATTQGDANDAPDPWKLNLNGTYAYRVAFSLPLIGYPAVWLHNGGRQLLFIVAGLAIIVAGLSLIRKDRTSPPRARAHDVDPEQGRSSSS